MFGFKAADPYASMKFCLGGPCASSLLLWTRACNAHRCLFRLPVGVPKSGRTAEFWCSLVGSRSYPCQKWDGLHRHWSGSGFQVGHCSHKYIWRLSVLLKKCWKNVRNEYLTLGLVNRNCTSYVVGLETSRKLDVSFGSASFGCHSIGINII